MTFDLSIRKPIMEQVLTKYHTIKYLSSAEAIEFAAQAINLHKITNGSQISFILRVESIK